jgi:predicted transposase YbfD/YdcC
MPKPVPHRRQHTLTEKLVSDSKRLRKEFAETDLDVANTFVRLASLDLQYGECEHAERLLDRAEEAANTVLKLIERLPENSARAIRVRHEELVRAISQVRKTSSSAGP